MPETDPRLRQCIGEIGVSLAAMRARHARGDARADPDGAELADLEGRHADLDRRAAHLDTALAKPDRSVSDALAADAEGLRQSVRRWIERQDAKGAPR